jgi:hypothetical protein
MLDRVAVTERLQEIVREAQPALGRAALAGVAELDLDDFRSIRTIGGCVAPPPQG